MEHPEWKNSIPIDLVVPYVDSSDPEWKKNFRETIRHFIGGNSPSRYRPLGLFKYFFRGVEANMPWIRKIHLIVASESQIPSWIERKNPRLNVVLHRDYIPAEFLPTFNSNVIEMFYHRIKDLSENFIIANDDIIAASYHSEYDYFRNDTPVDVKNTASLRKKLGIYDFNTTLVHDAEVLRKVMNNKNILPFSIYHKFNPMKKSTMVELWSKAGADFNKSLTRSPFRLSRNVTWHIFRFYRLLKGEFILDNSILDGYKFISVKNQLSLKSVSIKRFKTVCLNDDIKVNTPKVEQELNHHLIEAVGNAESSFEKGADPRKLAFASLTVNRLEEMSIDELKKHIVPVQDPEFIISVTSFGKRIANMGRMVHSVLVQGRRDVKLYLSLYKDDVPNITPFIKRLIDADIIGLLVSDTDYGPHLKYIPAMEKFRDKAIITFDDDRIYSTFSLDRLIQKYKEVKYKSVIANIAIEVQRQGEKVLPMVKWRSHRIPSHAKSMKAMAEGFGGVLYPPSIFPDMNTIKKEALEIKYDDDLFLRIMESRLGIPVTNTDKNGVKEFSAQINESLPWNLHVNINSITSSGGNRDRMINKYSAELLKIAKS